MTTPPTIDRPDPYRLMTSAMSQIKEAAYFWDKSNPSLTQIALAFSACYSLYVIAQCLLFMTEKPSQEVPE